MKNLIPLIILLSFFFIPQQGFTQSPTQEALRQMASETGAVTNLNRATGIPNFVRFPEALKLNGSSLEIKANNFLSQYGNAFGIEDASKEFKRSKEITDDFGFQHLTYLQYHKGVPVFDGQLRFHFNTSQELTAVNGVYIPWIKVSPNPEINEQEAIEIAKQHLLTNY